MKKELPLSGYKVIELATVVAAPTAGRLMAEFGADVIKIEPPSGDPLRGIGEMHMLPTDDGNNPMFDVFNTGKKLTSINLKSPEGHDVLMKMLSSADIFLTNTRMQALEKLGLDYETLKEKFPSLIYAHFSGFGLSGPDRNRPGYDSTAFWMRTGAVLDWMPNPSFPIRPSYAFGDIASSSYFLNGILIALLAREKSGHGTLVSTSLFNAGIWMNAPSVINAQPQYGRVYPNGRWDPWNLFNDYYRCSDGVWISPICKNYQRDRPLLAKLFSMPELVDDPDCEAVGLMRRAGKLEGYMRHLAAVIEGKSSAEWIELFKECDLPYEIVGSVQELYRDPQAWANGYFENVDYPDGCETAMPVPPIVLGEYDRRDFVPQGALGADTDSILSDMGYSEEEIKNLKTSKVVK